MASKQQKKFQKKKEREKRVRRQVLLQRETLRAPEREERAFQRKMKRITKLKKDMGDLNVWSDNVFLQMNDETLSQLEKNAKILRALEQQYVDETSKKKDLNEQLESEGFNTLDEKLGELHSRLVKQQKALYADSGLVEERSEAYANANEKLASCCGKEVSEVEVIKAPVSPTEEFQKLFENT
jgi:hypothetical protein